MERWREEIERSRSLVAALKEEIATSRNLIWAVRVRRAVEAKKKALRRQE